MLAETLYKQGYTEILPAAPPGSEFSGQIIAEERIGKVPSRPLPNGKWQAIDGQKYQAVIEDVLEWESRRANLAIRTSYFPAVDLDIRDEELVQIIRGMTLKLLGAAPTRTGQAPKLALLYHAPTPFVKQELTFTYRGQPQVIEILGRGQALIIHGTHPSGCQYTWDTKLPDPTKLTVITEEQVHSYLRGIYAWLAELDGVENLKLDIRETDSSEVTGDLSAPTISLLKKAVNLIPNSDDDFPERDDLVAMAYAIKGAAGEEQDAAKEIFFDFADRYMDGINPFSEMESLWNSLSEPTVGWGMIQKYALKYGLNRELASSEFEPVPAEPAPSPIPAGYTDVDLADRFRKEHQDMIRVLKRSKSDSTLLIRSSPATATWQEDNRNIVANAIREFCVRIGNEAGRSGDKRGQRIWEKLSNYSTQVTLANQLKTYSQITITPDQCNSDPDVINTPSGLYSLQTGRAIPMSEYNKPFYHTKQTTCAPDWTVATPVFDEFMQFVTGGDKELLALLHRYLGYALTGRTTEQILLFLYGDGQTGKGTLIRILESVLGDYIRSVQSNVFTKRTGGETHPTELTQFEGNRLVVAQEFTDDAEWAEDRLKSLTGSDTITARGMGENFYQYKPVHTLMLAGNRIPALQVVDTAIKRRVRLVPFKHKATPEQVSRNIEGKINSTELPGILAWLIDGSVLWYKEGLGTIPKAVQDETDNYFNNSDTLTLFMQEHVKRAEGIRCPINEMYQQWTKYQKGTGATKLDTLRVFSDKLAFMGIHIVQEGKTRFYEGVELSFGDGEYVMCSCCSGLGKVKSG